MSWSFDITGTREAVKAAVTTQLDKTAAAYAGKPEGDDVLAVKGRVLALVDALKLDEYWNGVSAKGNGSHSITGENQIVSASCGFSVMRVPLALGS
jgi:hypothetical protein